MVNSANILVKMKARQLQPQRPSAPDARAPRSRPDDTVKALARAFRWRRILDEGVYGSLDDLARVKGIASSYVSRVLRLTLLAPEIVEAILDGRQPAELQLDDLLEGFPLEWEGQRGLLAVGAPAPRDAGRNRFLRI